VPPELVERDKAKVESPEAMRDELIAQRTPVTVTKS